MRSHNYVNQSHDLHPRVSRVSLVGLTLASFLPEQILQVILPKLAQRAQARSKGSSSLSS
ncbi:hypothetical protein BC936DRAFT_148894 [Jimgerdemannia flammicorona]|uniref:Uncharacterized protein n=1 Tax=Jimgerdemannia flammicorona TaxID=994334 RepID=A0A433D227_9FUNG|nr:hypothetical protein BC936DRAFT_148894 [Jimgerdemannia flammicorona]